jgi:hypothetical protein
MPASIPGSATSTARQASQLMSGFITKLASTASGLGASLLGVQDSGSYVTGTTVEAVLAELGLVRPDVLLTDPGNAGAIAVTRSGCVPLVTAGAETRTLARPTFIGQMITLYGQTIPGNCAVTVTGGINVAGNTVTTITLANQSIQLIGVSNGVTLAWRVAENNGTTLS